MWAVLLLCGLISGGRSEFFHEPSLTELMSSTATMTSEFGFSMAYQESPPRLVVGAPQQDIVGKVFNCPLTDLSKKIDCDVIDMSNLKIEETTMTARQESNLDQKYLFGTSISATADYFLTCAPLLPKYLTQRKRGSKINSFLMFGACYVYDNRSNTFTEWKDHVVNLQNVLNHKNSIPLAEISRMADRLKAGGLGCNTLADTENGFMLVAKSAYPAHILTVPIDSPLVESTSLFKNYYKQCIISASQLFNTGYGMAVGHFFDKSIPLYAVSTLHMNMKGNIFFLEIRDDKLVVFDSDDEVCFDGTYITNQDIGTMFGYALASGDINLDGLSELFVGAPAQPVNNYRKEMGAIHIYIGGDTSTRNDARRMRTILGRVDRGRFGAAIATSDVDGDSLTEIFVSAPYENEEAGVVYVLSGFELNKVLMGPNSQRQITVGELERTQLIRGDSGARHFGFSLKVIKDIDGNGCDELAIGSPASSKVRLLRCLPAVTAFTTLQLLGDKIVKEDASKFKVKVCLNVTVHQKCDSVIGSISVACQVDGHTSMPEREFTYVLTTAKQQIYCKDITVVVNKAGSTQYTFSTNIKVKEGDVHGSRVHRAYKPWAVLSPQSVLENSIPVKQYCTGVECEPKLSYDLSWEGTETIDTKNSKTSPLQSFVIWGENTGADAKTVNLRVVVSGARVTQLTSQCYKEPRVDEYTCSLPRPLKRDSSYSITMWVNTTDAENVLSLNVTAWLYDDVFTKTIYYPMSIQVPFKLDTDSVLVEGWDNNLNITDKDMEDNKITSFSDSHDYYISNNGAVTWKNLIAVLEITKEKFIQNVEIVTTENCEEQPLDDKKKYLFYCQLTIAPGSNKKIVVSFNISKENIESDIGKIDLSTNSKISLILQPTDEVKYVKVSTHIHYQEILSVANNMMLFVLIAVVVALVLLLILSFVLYKCGFFKRAEKKQLNELRESVRKRSIRKASESIRSPKPSTAEDNNCEIEVVDDCVFHEVDTSTQQTEEVPSTKDNVELINSDGHREVGL